MSALDALKPEPVTLTPYEQALFNEITFDLRRLRSTEAVRSSCSKAAVLARCLLERRAIPDVRLRYFTDPQLNVGGRRKSRRGVFEANGTTGAAILGHIHFLEYLRYFILGPDLPPGVIVRFQQVVADDAGTTGMVRDQLRRFARAETRGLSADRRREAVEEFFKLALECGLDLDLSRSIRDAARTAS